MFRPLIGLQRRHRLRRLRKSLRQNYLQHRVQRRKDLPQKCLRDQCWQDPSVTVRPSRSANSVRDEKFTYLHD